MEKLIGSRSVLLNILTNLTTKEIIILASLKKESLLQNIPGVF